MAVNDTGAARAGTTIQNISFLLLVAVTTFAFFALVRDLLMPVFWAAVVAIVFHPIHRRYLGVAGGRRSLAALLTLLTILVVVMAPLFLVGLAMSREVIALQEQIASGAIDLRAPLRFLEELAPRVDHYLSRLGVDMDRLGEQLSSGAVTASRFIASRTLEIGENILRFTVLFFLMLYLLFFFLRDGPKLIDAIIRALPLGDRRERRLIAKFAEVARATIKGTLVVGLVQGALGGLLFFILDIPAPVFWGAVMALFAVLPAVGTGLIWGPAAIILLALGEVARGLIMIAVGVLVIGLVDNLLRPILVGRDTQMPDYLVLLSTLGGLAVFGLSGFVIGPIIASFFLAVWEMFAQAQASANADLPGPSRPGGTAAR